MGLIWYILSSVSVKKAEFSRENKSITDDDHNIRSGPANENGFVIEQLVSNSNQFT